VEGPSKDRVAAGSLKPSKPEGIAILLNAVVFTNREIHMAV